MKALITAGVFAILSAVGGIVYAADSYQGWWWDASKDGMGLNIAQQGDTLAAAWYHFDDDGSSSYVIFAGKVVNGVLAGALQKASGPPPGPGYSPTQVARWDAGTGTLRFTSANTAVFDYTLDGRSGSLNLGRFDIQDASSPSWWSYGIAGRVCGYETWGMVKLEEKDGASYDLITVDYNDYPKCIYSSISAIPGTTAAYQCEVDRFGNIELEFGRIRTNRLQIENNALVFEFSSEPDSSSPSSCILGNIQRIVGTRFINEEKVLSGWWWDPEKDGMGINIEQKGGMIALAWYHFDENGTPGYALLAGKDSSSVEKRLGNALNNESSQKEAALFEISGLLQGASGPPPGPGYDPDSVVRKSVGKGTLTMKLDPKSPLSSPSLTFSYQLNGKEEATLNLVPFVVQAMLPPFAEAWEYTSNHIQSVEIEKEKKYWFDKRFGTAKLVKLENNNYQLTTKDNNSGESCIYDLNLWQVGATYSGTGTVECGSGSSGIVTVSRLITAWDTLVFDHHISWPGKNEQGTYFVGETINLAGLVKKRESNIPVKTK